MQPICFYHASCLDGFGSAYIVHEEVGAELVPMHYGREVPWHKIQQGQIIFIVDFSFDADIIHRMAAIGEYVILIDHHKTAEHLKDPRHSFAKNVKLLIDTSPENSGVGLTWKYFNPNTPMPVMFRHIQDRDTWQFVYPQTKAITAALFTYDMTIDMWQWLLSRPILDIIKEGECLLRKQEKDIESIMRNSYIGTFAGYNVPMVNSNVYMSELGNRLAKDKPFAVVYYYDGAQHCYNISLRSNDKGLDVSEIAKKFGGGGHRNAAGCRLESGQLRTD